MIDELIKRAENVNLKILDISDGFVTYKTLKGPSGFSGKSSIPSFEKFVRRRELEKEIRLLKIQRRSFYNNIQRFKDIGKKIEELDAELKKFIRK